MLKGESIDSTNIICVQESVSKDEKKLSYLQELKQVVFDEIIDRIEKDMDITAADILDTARQKLKILRENSMMIALALKPICLLFLFELHLAVPTNI